MSSDSFYVFMFAFPACNALANTNIQRLNASSCFFFLIFINLYFFLVVLDLPYCMCTFSNCGKQGLLSTCESSDKCGLLLVVTSLVVEYRL